MKDDTIQILNGLIEICLDGEQGYQAAARRTLDGAFKGLCENYVQQRARFVIDLQVAVRRLGVEPTKGGSLAGALHRGWMSLRSMLAGGSQESLLAEVGRGEGEARAAYEKALRGQLPLDVRSLLERQHIQVKEAHDRILSLERELELIEKTV